MRVFCQAGRSRVMDIFVEKRISPKHPKLTGKCTRSHQVIITHGSEVDPTGIDGLSNFSMVMNLVKLILMN